MNPDPAIPAAPSPLRAWSPLSIRVFRWLWIATVVSYIGTWAQEAGGPWLMRDLCEGRADKAFWVALVAVAGNLPIALLSLPAGALADVVDRRRLLIFTQVWMLLASGTLGVLAYLGRASPAVVLALTAVLGVGTALSQPPFQAIVPELVGKSQMPLAVALNSVGLNVARAVGPAVAGLVIARLGVGASFILNAITFVGVAAVLVGWRRPPQPKPQQPERLWAAMWTGLHYVRQSPALRSVLLRVAVFITCAVAMWSQIPLIARDQLGLGPQGYGLLMACLGCGAVVGVLLMPHVEHLLRTDPMVNLCTACFAAGVAGLALVRTSWPAYGLMVFLGANWVIIPTNFNVATQRASPPWVKGRALAMYLLVLFGSWAAGSAAWGWITTQVGIRTSLLLSAAGLAAGLALVRAFPLSPPEGPVR